MKETILSIAIAAIFLSCSQKPSENTITTQAAAAEANIPLTDYSEWKEKQEQLGEKTFASDGVNEAEPVVEAKPEPAVIYKEVPAKQPRVQVSRQVISHNPPVAEAKEGPIAKAPAPPTNGKTREPYGRNATGTQEVPAGPTDAEGSGESNSTGASEGDVAASTPAEVPQKKEGMSKATKGGVIGGASGAVIGAIFSKNKAKGAVIGGVVGAAGGYIFGRQQDKKDGRNE